jgi:cell division protein FtsB
MMVVNTRIRTAAMLIGLYVLTTMLIGYFGFHAYNGNRGLKAQQDLAQQLAALNAELTKLKTERADWERRASLLRPESLDPDMLDERARAMLDYVHSRDLIFSAKSTSSEITGSIPARAR